jgi:hypothetical protein
MAVAGQSVGSYELGPIRPPSEAFSLLIRVTRNCPWNRCLFCPIYKGAKFELRPVEDIKKEITTARAIYDKIAAMGGKGNADDLRRAAAAVYNSAPNEAWRNVALWIYSGAENAFLQDANTLIMKTPQLVEVIRFLKQTFPSISRVTSYSRSKTAARKTVEELKELREAGLSRLHIGMESGSDRVLKLLDKGVTAADHIAGGKKVMESGISLCLYIMPGAGGKALWREHALETARVLNEIDPDFIRFRTMTVQPRMLLHKLVLSGEFVRASDEEIVEELKLLLEKLDCHSSVVSDHMINLLPEIEGKLPEDKQKMLDVIGRFQSMSPEGRDNYKLGRRLGIYSRLDDMEDTGRRGEVDRIKKKLKEEGQGVTDELLFELMERYI